MLVFVVCMTLGISCAQYVPMRHHKYYPPRFLQAQDHYRYYSLLPQEENLNNYHCVKLCFAYLLPQYVLRNVYQCYSNFDCPENHICSFNENLQHGTCVLLRRYLHDFEAQGVAPPQFEPSFEAFGHRNENPSEFRDIIRCSRATDCPPNTKCVSPGICAFLASSILSESAGSGDYRLKRNEQDDDNDDLIFDDDNYAHKGLCPSPGNSTHVYPKAYTEYLLCISDLDCSNDRKCCDYSAYQHKVCLKAEEETE